MNLSARVLVSFSKSSKRTMAAWLANLAEETRALVERLRFDPSTNLPDSVQD